MVMKWIAKDKEAKSVRRRDSAAFTCEGGLQILPR